MKRLLLITLILILGLSIPAMAQQEPPQHTEKDKPKSICPVTKMSDSCFACHAVSGGKFRLKEFPLDNHIVYPNRNTKVKGWETGKMYGYYKLTGIDEKEVSEFFDFMREIKLDKAVIEIFSGGGSVFSALKIVSLIETFQAEGKVVETRVNGAALSAGFYIFVAGSKGHRYANSFAQLMWHEIQSLTGFGFVIDTPSSAEEKSRVLRYLQDSGNAYLATKGNVGKEELDEKIKNKEFWMTGQQALDYGFADQLIGK